MGNFEQKDGGGVLFPNNRKKSERAPDHTGEVKINGVLYELAGWQKQGKNGDFISLSIKPKGQRSIPLSPQVPMTGGGLRRNDPEDQEIPFLPERR